MCKSMPELMLLDCFPELESLFTLFQFTQVVKWGSVNWKSKVIMPCVVVDEGPYGTCIAYFRFWKDFYSLFMTILNT